MHRLWTQGQRSTAATSSGRGLKSNESQGLNSKAGPGPGLPAGEGEVMRRVMPLPRGRQLAWGDRTHLMAILNVTPDSFSDGGQLLAGGLEGAVGQARRLVQEGAGVLDVGGQSTRPGAVRLTAQEEAARVVPFVRWVRVVLMQYGGQPEAWCWLLEPSCHWGEESGLGGTGISLFAMSCCFHQLPVCVSPFSALPALRHDHTCATPHKDPAVCKASVFKRLTCFRPHPVSEDCGKTQSCVQSVSINFTCFCPHLPTGHCGLTQSCATW